MQTHRHWKLSLVPAFAIILASALFCFGQATPQTTGINFFGVGYSDSQAGIPDTMGAIGPNHFVQVINRFVCIQDRNTGTRLGTATSDNFFRITVDGVTYPRPNYATSDPRVLYDRHSGHWIASMMEAGISGGNEVFLAVSVDSDPVGPAGTDWINVKWRHYLLHLSRGADFTDFPTLGVDDNGVYLAVQYTPDGSAIAAIPKAQLLAGNLIVYTLPVLDATHIQPVVNFDSIAANAPAWFVTGRPSFNQDIRYNTLTWSGGVPALGGTWNVIATPPYGYKQPVPEPGGSIDPGPSNLGNAVIRNGVMWTCRNVPVNSLGAAADADRTGCEWLKLQLSGSTAVLADSGRVFDPTTIDEPTTDFIRSYFMPSITVNGQGHVVIGFTGSSIVEYPGTYFAGRLANDPAGFMGTPRLYHGGEGAVNADGISWGDYSATTLDPNDDMSIWTIQEYMLAPPLYIANWIAQTLSPAPTLDSHSFVACPGEHVSLTLSGTGFYDGGANFPHRLGVALTGGSPNGIANVVVTYVNSTTVTVAFDVASNAQLGSRNIVLTNPDGQSATLVQGFTVTGIGLINLGNVYTHLEQPDGKILVGGDFGVVRLNANGSIDSTFNCTYPNGHGSVFTLAAGPDGSVYVGGSFSWSYYDDDTEVYTVYPANLVRINSGGSLDWSFNPNPGGTVYALAVQSDGNVVAGGDFLYVGASYVKRITRVSSYGGIDSQFHYHNRGLDNTVRAIAIQPGGKILVGGDFFYFDDNGNSSTISAPHIIRLNSDGTRDTGFSASASPYPGGVYALAVQSDGKIIAGGNPTRSGWSTGHGLARLFANGALDVSGVAANGTVTSIIADAGSTGYAIFGGSFTSAGGETRNGLAQLAPDGALIAGFTANSGVGGTSPAVYTISRSSNNTIIISGNFTSYNGATRHGIARVSTQ